MLFVEAAGAAPRGVLGAEHDQNVKEGRRDDGNAAQHAKEPVAWAIAAPRASVSPACQEPGRCQEDHENQTGQPGGFAGDHFDFEEIERNRGQQERIRENANAHGARRNRSRIALLEKSAEIRPSTA